MILWQEKGYRIIEIQDDDADIENLKGDCYNAMVNSDIDSKLLREQEIEFENLVNSEGVYGYELQVWDDRIDCGWTSVDSCWGFVGRYDENLPMYRHYIVNELKSQIERETK